MHFKITACTSVPQLSKLCNIRNSTLINYQWHNGYGNGHWLIISHTLFHISVSNLQHESKLFSTALPKKLLLKSIATLLSIICCDGNIARQRGLRQPRAVQRALGYHILIGKLLAKHIDLETYKCAKCKVSLWTHRIYYFFHPFVNKW